MSMNNATASSRWFRVKDVEAFKADIGQLPNLTVVDAVGEERPADSVYLYSADGYWPEERPRQPSEGSPPSDDPLDEMETIYLPELLAPHLVEGEVAILEQVSNEDLDILYAITIAVNAKGRIVTYDFDAIAQMARDLLL